MNLSTFVGIYVAISLIFALANVLLAAFCFRHKGKVGLFLGLTAVTCAVIDIVYLISALSTDYFTFSAVSSIYFICIDLVLLSLLEFAANFTRYSGTSFMRSVRWVVYGYAAFDILAFAINPFWEVIISYAPQADPLPYFEYVMRPLYVAHLVYTYSLILCAVLQLVNKIRQVPREYRTQYLSGLFSIGLIVLVNAVFLYIPLPSVFSKLDLSVFGYTFGLIFLYFSSLNYSTHGMLDAFRSSIFENIMQGIVLFDYTDRLVMHNSQAGRLLPDAGLHRGLSFDEFLPKCDLDQRLPRNEDVASVQCYIRHGETNAPVRCDHRILYNKRSQKIGRLLVFTDAAVTSDILTGFHMWDHFQKAAPEQGAMFTAPSTVAIMDISGLTLINKTRGRSEGDQAIQELARLMQECLPRQTYFVRGQDANLIALINTTSLPMVTACVRQVVSRSNYNVIYSISSVGTKNANVLAAIGDALTGLQVKKLMDQESIHSQLLTSLMRALEECDHDTEAHVRRTQKLGELLGRRIGLDDVQLSQLSLLCMLHDIGKIGIPLEILNKPDKLTSAEWATIQTHAEKGYQIALSVEALSGIADSIRHHHERWDGTGYPDKLAENDIPLLSRIISVVDAYDAMVSNRSYRRALTQEAAIAELERCSGSQFDPQLVTEFMEVIPLAAREAAEEETAAPASPLSAIPQADNSQSENVHPITYARYIVDENMLIVSPDESLTVLTGYTVEEIRSRGMHQYDLIPPEDRAEYFTKVSRSLSNSTGAYLEHRILCKDGRIIYVFCYGKNYFDSVARANYTEIVVSDISQTYSMRTVTGAPIPAHIRIPQDAGARDSLTDLITPAVFRSRAEAVFAAGQQKLLLLRMDVDCFTQYNETHGQQAGNRFLMTVAQALSAALRKEDLACRVDEDEFAAAICFDSECDNRLIQQRAQQIFDKISMTLAVNQRTGSLSMGAAISGGEAADFDRLTMEAVTALTASKQAGRSRLTISQHS